MKKIFLLAVFLFISISVVKGQSGNFIDLTIEREKISPNDGEYLKKHGVSIVISGGVTCGTDSKEIQKVKNPLIKVTLEKLDKPEYLASERITYEIIVENTSTESIAIPWSIEMEKIMEASDKKLQPHIESIFGIGMENNKGEFNLFMEDSLHGSEAMPGSLKILQPGEKARIRTTRYLGVPKDGFLEGETIKSFELKAEFSMYRRPYRVPSILSVISTNSVRVQIRKLVELPEQDQ